MLQFAQKQGRVKRKALLINAKGGLDFEALKNEVPVEEPQPLLGDAFDRMRSDPELIAMKKRFAWSVGAVAALVLVATLFHLNRDRWFPQLAKPALPAVVQNDSSGVEPKSALPKDTRIATAQRPDKKPDSLDFKLPDKPVVASPSNGSTRLNVPPLGPTPRMGAKNPIPGVSIGPSATAGNMKPLTNQKGGGMIGALPRSLFRISKKGTVVQVKHDLPKAKATLSGYLKAVNVNQRLQFVVDRADVESRMRAYYEKNGDGPISFARIEESEVVGNGTVSEHDVVMLDGSVRRASVVKTGDESYSVDWPSFVGESEMEWPALMMEKPSKPVMVRVTVEPSNVFEGDFSDSRWLLCLKLTHPVREDAAPIFAYVERQSGLGREMDYWLKLGQMEAMPMTLRVKYPLVASAAHQVWLTELVSPGWVLRRGQPIVQAKGPGEARK